uniref:Uncharacterized protein n=1 Tax=Sphaerodactylus townsendi TaxID=933632 RepID=A0ACB8EDS0_9SAUR
MQRGGRASCAQGAGLRRSPLAGCKQVGAPKGTPSDLNLLRPGQRGRAGRDYTTINERPRRLSAGTIAIIAILSILFAILLASFIAALIYTRSDIYGNGGNISVQDSVSVTHYTTHHVYNQASAKS